jgi:hypothetical protein
MAAAAVTVLSGGRKQSVRRQESGIIHVDINAVSLLPDKKDWIAEHNLQMLMLNG